MNGGVAYRGEGKRIVRDWVENIFPEVLHMEEQEMQFKTCAVTGGQVLSVHTW